MRGGGRIGGAGVIGSVGVWCSMGYVAVLEELAGV